MIAGCATLLLLPPTRYSFYPRCPFFLYLHLQCPGCGTTRALAALLHGHLREALHLNALTTLLVPLTLFSLARGLRRHTSSLASRSQPNPAMIYATLALAAIFTIARNLPL